MLKNADPSIFITIFIAGIIIIVGIALFTTYFKWDEYEKKYLSIDIYNYKPLFLIDINYDLLLIPSNTLKEIRSSEFETYAVYNPNATLNHLVTPPNIEEHKVIGLSDAFISPDKGITLIKVSCEYDYVYIIEYDPAKKLWGRIIRNYISRW